MPRRRCVIWAARKKPTRPPRRFCKRPKPCCARQPSRTRCGWNALWPSCRCKTPAATLPAKLPAAVAADAAASTLIEQLCDEIEGELRREYQARGLYITGRYSPGYGDCPLALQSVFAAYLDTGRKIGLTVGSSGLLLPRKSVTAILGISQKPVTGYRAGCAHCVLQKTCQYRKRGVSCEQE